MLMPYQKQLERALTRHSQHHKTHAFILNEISDRLLARLAYLKLIPEKILTIGASTHYDAKQLASCYSNVAVTSCDLPQAMTLPLSYTAKQFDLVFANMLLPAVIDYSVYWHEIQRLLKPQGILLFSALGVDSFKELRTSFEYFDKSYAVNQFPDLHDIGDSLVEAGFNDPVIDREVITLTYANLALLLQELKALGSIKLLEQYDHLYYGKGFWTALEKYYQDHFAVEQQKLSVTLEVYYGIAFAPTNVKNKDEVSIAIASISRKPRA